MMTCIRSARGDTCATHGGGRRGAWSAWFVIDEHEFEGCVVGAAEYIAELENMVPAPIVRWADRSMNPEGDEIDPPMKRHPIDPENP